MAIDTKAADTPQVHFRGASDPFTAQTEDQLFDPGMTLDEMLAKADVLPKQHMPLTVSVNGIYVEHTDWPTVVPKAGDAVVALYRPAVTAAFIGSLLGGAYAVAGTAITAGTVAGASAGALLTVGLITVGINAGLSFLLSYAVSAIVGSPKQNNNDFAQSTQSPTLRGASNRFYANGPVWEIFGRHRVTLPLAASVYSEISGESQYLRLLFDAGKAPATISDLKIGDSLASNYQEVDVEIHDSGVYPYPLRIFPNDVQEVAVSQNFEPTLGPSTDLSKIYLTGPDVIPTQFADELSITLNFTQGLRTIGENGGKHARGTDIEIYAERVDTPTTLRKIVDYPHVVTGHPGVTVEIVQLSEGLQAGTNVFRISGNVVESFSISITWPVTDSRGKYSVNVLGRPYGKYTTSGSGAYVRGDFATNRGGTGRAAFTADQFTFSSVRSTQFEAPVNLQDRVLIEMRIKASDQFDRTPSEVNAIVERHVPVWDGAAWLPAEASRNPAWHALEVLRTEAEIPDSRLDLPEWKRFADLCEPSPGIYDRPHDRSFDFDGNVELTVHDILSSGFANLSRYGGIYAPTIEEKKTVFKQHFTPMNTAGYSFQRSFQDVPHAIRVKYLDPNANWTPNELLVYDKGYGLTSLLTLHHVDLVAADQSCTRQDVGDYLVDGFKANTWVRIGDYSLQISGLNFWSSRTKDSLHGLIQSVTNKVLTFWPGTIQADGTANTTTFETVEATKFETLELPGVTEVFLAWKHGRRPLLLGPPRSMATTVSTDWEGIASKRGDLVYHSHWVLEDKRRWSRVTARVLDPGDGDVVGLLLDTDMEYETGDSYAIIVRVGEDASTYSSLVDNLFDVNGVATIGEVALYIDELPGDHIPDVGDLVTFGIVNQVADEMLVTKITSTDGYRNTVVLQPHAGAEIDEWLAEPEPTFTDDFVNPTLPNRASPGLPIITRTAFTFSNISDPSIHAFQVALGVAPGNVSDYRLRVEWAPAVIISGETIAVGFDVQVRVIAVTTNPFSVFSFPGVWGWVAQGTPLVAAEADLAFLSTSPIDGTPLEVVDVRVRSISSGGRVSGWVEFLDVPLRAAGIVPPQQIAAATSQVLTANGLEQRVLISWLNDVLVTSWRVYIYGVDDPLNPALYFVGDVVTNQVEVTNLPEGQWSVSVTAMDAQLNMSVPSIFTYLYRAAGPGVYIPPPTGLRLEGENLGVTESTAIDFSITWNPVTLGLDPLTGAVLIDTQPMTANMLEGYVVDVYNRDTAMIVRTANVSNGPTPRYVYTLASNVADNGGVAARNLTFRVSSYVGASLSSVASLAATNPPPRLPVLTHKNTASTTHYGIVLDWSQVVDPTTAGLLVWAKEGATPLTDLDLDPVNLVYNGPVQNDITFAQNPVLFQFRYAAFDALSSEVSGLVVSPNEAAPPDLTFQSAGGASADGAAHPISVLDGAASAGYLIIESAPVTIGSIQRTVAITADFDMTAGGPDEFTIYRVDSGVVQNISNSPGWTRIYFEFEKNPALNIYTGGYMILRLGGPNEETRAIVGNSTSYVDVDSGWTLKPAPADTYTFYINIGGVPLGSRVGGVRTNLSVADPYAKTATYTYQLVRHSGAESYSDIIFDLEVV